MDNSFVSHAAAFWTGFACGIVAVKFGWPRLKAKVDALRGKLRDKL